jgi:peptide-methionine (R)-S-oxide reductase
MPEKVNKTDAEWRAMLTNDQYRILREHGTERAFTGKYTYSKADGMYHCAGCDLPLFKSDTKFESGSGWPSFWDVAEQGNVELIEDNSYGMRRVEVRCAACGGHLGHVFPDGPRETTGLRYCINSASINLRESE